MKDAAESMQPAMFAMFNMLALWQVSAPDLLFTLGGMQAAMPEGVAVTEVSNVILGQAGGIFFDRREQDPLPLIVSQQCVAILLQQLRSPKWDMDTEAAKELGKKGVEAIKRRRTAVGFVAKNDESDKEL